MDKYINNYIQKIKSKGLSDSTIETYTNTLNGFMDYLNSKDKSLQRISENDWNEYILFLKDKGKKSGGIRHTTVVLKQFIKYLVKQGIVSMDIDDLPIYKSSKEEGTILSQEDVDMIVKGVNGTSLIALRDRAIVLLLSTTGLRASELCNLKRNALSIDAEGTVSITLKGKRDKVRTVYTTFRVKNAIDTYLNERKDDIEYLFISRLNQKMSRKTLYAMLKKRARNAGITGVGAHTFRHFFATSMLKKGIALSIVKDLMAHDSILSTQIYTHYGEADKARAYKSVMEQH